MRCDLEVIGQERERNRYRCKRCGRVCVSRETDPARVGMQCGKPGLKGERKVLKDKEAVELFGESDQTLIGNRIKALTDAIGIPPCGGCTTRREWLNKAHTWLRSLG